MALFAAVVEFGEDNEIRLETRPRHREYLRSLLDAGKLAMSGPWVDETGALFIYNADDLSEAERMFDADPYQSAGVIANAKIKEWHVVLQAPSLGQNP